METIQMGIYSEYLYLDINYLQGNWKYRDQSNCQTTHLKVPCYMQLSQSISFNTFKSPYFEINNKLFFVSICLLKGAAVLL